ncbi:MAG: peptidoglycan-binding protein [Alphaproteobacteria bacterium]|nr:peptidoglycan-binding protein [Alphaproteobacteria bacterium]
MTRRTEGIFRTVWCRAAAVAAVALPLFLGACVGPQLDSGEGGPASGGRAASEAPTRAQITEIQRLLAEQGYDPGPVDGLLGRRTAAAIDQYQRDKGLGRTGMATRDLLAHLRGQPRAAPVVLAVEAAAATGGYEVGERYVFAGGITHDVVEVRSGQVKWQTSEGESFRALRPVGLPVLEWEYGSWRGRNQSSRDREASWPPARGIAVSFDVRSEEWTVEDGSRAPRQSGELRWTCLNEGAGEIEVPAGRFTVDIIACERWPVPAGDWHKRVWYYAPSVGHYIRRDDLDTAGLQIESLTLVAALPGGGRAVQTGLRGVLRDTLANRARNEPVVWNDAAGARRFVIRVTRDFRGADGQSCRAYTISRAGQDRRRDFPGVSCYDKAKKQWRAPGL